jgi:LmbE family N-acetylglucosaminyl deacetylase
MDGMDLAERLARREVIGEPVALVVAHPDDETLMLGGLLALFGRLTLIHLTDGAPRDGRDARREGFASADAYAEARSAELGAALDALGARAERVSLGVPDQETVLRLPGLTGRLTELLGGQAAVITHAYEGGHPDHDSAAFAVAHAVAALAAGTPEHWEAALYHAGPDGEVWGAFWPDPRSPETAITLRPAEQARLAAGIAAFATQQRVIAAHGPGAHRLRRAPPYDFAAPPPPGACLYERWGFALTGEGWRAHAKAAAC